MQLLPGVLVGATSFPEILIVIQAFQSMRRQLNILAVAYVFPPDSGSGTFRTLYFANEWARQGDHVTVITVKEEYFLAGAAIDRALTKTVHPAISIVRASAVRPLQWLLAAKRFLSHRSRGTGNAASFRHEQSAALDNAVPSTATLRVARIKDLITDILSCPDEHVGWIPGAVWLGIRLAKARNIDCIYATGGPWSGQVAGALISRFRGIPLVLDFRDPWMSNPNIAERTSLSRWIQERLESYCVRSARCVIANTDELRQDFIGRYSSLDSTRFVTVTNGFEEFPLNNANRFDRFTIVHAGALYASRNPENFFRAVGSLIADGLIPPDEIAITLVGGLSTEGPGVAEMLGTGILREVVEVMPRVSHEEAMRIQRTASALLLVQTGFPLQVPRKLYEYISIARPVLAIAETRSATAKLVEELQLGQVAEDSVVSIRSALLRLYGEWKSGNVFVVGHEKLQTYNNRHLSNRIRNIMAGL